jgi:hypothetical protein
MEQNKTNTASGGVVTPEQADNELTAWLDEKRVKPRKRKESSDTIETLIEAIEDGDITFDEKGDLIQILSDPAGEGSLKVEKLKYKTRITLKEVRVRLKNVKSNDIDGRVVAYISAATGENSAVIDELSTTDWSLSQSIAVFFM